MEQLKLLRRKKTSFVDRQIKNYNNLTDEQKKARDENAEALFLSHLNGDLKKIANDVGIMKAIIVIFTILSVIIALFLAVEYL